MNRIIPYSDYDSPFFESYDDNYAEPDPPRIEYKQDEKLFEEVLAMKGYGGILLDGSPEVGDGLWLLWDEEYPPEDYCYTFDPDYDADIDECIAEGTWENWATDLWKKEKDRVGSGLKDFEDGNKILIKIDPELRDYLIEELDGALSMKYDVHPEGRKFSAVNKIGFTPEKQKSLKRALFILENYDF